jgi:WD40 repeat protein
VAVAEGRADLLESSHAAAVSGLAFCGGVSNALASCGVDGFIRLWSLDGYDPLWVHEAPLLGVAPTAAMAGSGRGAGAAGGAAGGSAAAGASAAATSPGPAALVAFPPTCLWVAPPCTLRPPPTGAAAAGPARPAGTLTLRGGPSAGNALHHGIGFERTSGGGAAAFNLVFPGHTTRGMGGMPVPRGPAFAEDVTSAAPAAAADGLLPCQVYAGFGDGTLRAYDAGAPSSVDGLGTREAWRQGAHKGGVRCVGGTPVTVLTGGEDGRVCVWSRSNGSLVLQLQDHSRPVVAVLTDARLPWRLLSLGEDRALNVYDLRSERRTRAFSLARLPEPLAAANFTCAAQNAGPGTEGEVLAGTSHGFVVCWDVQVPEVPVGVFDVLAAEPAAGSVPGRVASPMPGSTGSAFPDFNRLTGARNRSTLGDVVGGLGTPAYGGIEEGACGRGPPASSGAGAWGGSTGAGGGEASGARAECRITAMAMAPAGRLLALTTHTGFLLVLEVGPSAPAGGALAEGGAAGTAGGAGDPMDARSRRSSVRAAPPHVAAAAARSRVSSMSLLFSHAGFSACTCVRWSPDGRQVVVAAEDGCISVFNCFL